VYIPHTKGVIMSRVKTLRMPEWLEKAMEELAVKADRSFSKEMVRAAREYVERNGVKCPE
jgi:predicted transcriptional regulator